jgi:O-antigen ligase
MQLNQLNKLKEKWAVFLVIIFVFWGFISLIFSPIKLTDGLFGLPGRHTGVLTYLFLSIYFVAMLLISDKKFYSSLIKTLYSTALIAMLYGFLQTVNLDPINWSSPPPAAFSFFGNQNFLSAFIGIISVSGLGYLFSKMTKNKHKSLIIIFTFFSLLLMNFTDSTQGYLIFLVGLSVIILIWLKHQEKYSRYLTFIIGFFVSGIILVVFDLLQKTPWPSVLYEPSVSARGDFWRSAWRMSLENPVFGVGLDGFVDHYRLNRDLSAVLARGSEIRTDSAHNIFLELLSGGGFPLLMAYLAINGLALRAVIKVLKRDTKFVPYFVALFTSWIAFLIFSAVSINQIGVGIWGWLFTGALIGYEISTRNDLGSVGKNTSKAKRKGVSTLPASSGIIGFLGGLLGLGLAFIPFNADMKYKAAIQIGAMDRIIASTKLAGAATFYTELALDTAIRNNFAAQADELVRQLIRIEPHSYMGWKAIWALSTTTADEKKMGIAKMMELDPFNPNNPKS